MIFPEVTRMYIYLEKKKKNASCCSVIFSFGQFFLTTSVNALEDKLTMAPTVCVSGLFPAQVLDFY